MTEDLSTYRKATTEESPISIHVKRANQVDFQCHIGMPEFEEVKARRNNIHNKMNERNLRAYPYEISNNPFKTSANTVLRKTAADDSIEESEYRRGGLKKNRELKKIPFAWLTFKNSTSRDVHRFRCFNQRDLGFRRKEFLAQIVDVENDDDYATDDDILHRSIQKVNDDLTRALADHLDGQPTLPRRTRKLVYGVSN